MIVSEAIDKQIVPLSMRDGSRSEITVYEKPSLAAATVIVITPAMAVPADYYEPLALKCVENGWNVVTADLRGNGRSSVRASRSVQFGYREHVEYELPAVIGAVRERFPSNRLVLLGHSLGGQLSALYMSVNPGCVQGLILIASGSVHYRGWGFPQNIGVLIGTQVAATLARALGVLPGRLIGFGGTESARLIGDWAREALTGRYHVAGSTHDFEALLRTIAAPVLALSFEGDFFAPRQAVLNLCKKLTNADVSHRHLTPKDFGLPHVGHFQWVKCSDPVVEVISEWMEN
jgi:predicted alpha/beta hydrolase